MIDPPKIIGPRLLGLREALGFETQEEFAGEIGYGKSTYNPWENGKRSLTFVGACRIRKRFNIHLDYLFFGANPQLLPSDVRENLQKAAKKRKAA